MNRALVWIVLATLLAAVTLQTVVIHGLRDDLVVQTARVKTLKVDLQAARAQAKVVDKEVKTLADGMARVVKDLKAQGEVDERFMDMITALRLRMEMLEAAQVELNRA